MVYPCVFEEEEEEDILIAHLRTNCTLTAAQKPIFCYV